MRILLLFFLFTCGRLFAQNLDVQPLSMESLTLKQKATDEVYYIPMRFTDGRATRTNVAINVNTTNGTAIQGFDWDLVTPLTYLQTPASPADFALGIRVRAARVSKVNTTFSVSFDLAPGTPDHNVRTLTFQIVPSGGKTLPDTAKWNVRIVTGSNFDFFDSPTFKNFAGDLNIFLPDLFQKKLFGKDVSIGFQAGFFNFRYFDADSSNGNISTDRYLLNRTVTEIVPRSTQYIRETYALNSKMNYNTFGAYFHPMVRLTEPESKWFDAYMTLHIEMLWRTQILTYTKTSLIRDTLTYSPSDSTQGVVIQSFPGLRPTYSRKTFEDGYYGIGFPMKVNIKKAFEFFITPTFGRATFEGQRATTVTKGRIVTRTYEQVPMGQWFLLTKAQLVTTLAPLDIALGGEFRKLFGQRTFYAVYLGAALSLDKFVKK